MPTSVLVTGAGGFVGANLTRRLRDEGHEVHALVRPESESWRLSELGTSIRLERLDMRDGQGLADLTRRISPRWVFHLAAHGAYSWQRDDQRILATNVLGTAALAAAARAVDVDAFVNAGSSSEYGLKDHPARESELVEPNSTYAVSKVAATLYLQTLAREQERHIVTLRLYSVYGPWEEPNRLMPTLAVRALRGRLPRLVDPATARDFVHVDDVVEAFLAAARAHDLERGTILNVGSGVQTTIGELVELARRTFAIDAEPEWSSMPGRAWDTSSWVANVERVADQLGWRSSITLEGGLRGLAQWLREAPDRRRRYELTIDAAAAAR